jgi:hypothetical protein
MATTSSKEWKKQFGIDHIGVPSFFTAKSELNEAKGDASQSHVLRRAFDLLELDGILCTENVPLVYFKEIKTVRPEDVLILHRRFWNHGGAPIMVLITADDVHIYSGLVRPAPQPNPDGSVPGLVEILKRTSTALQEFLPAVESGEFFRRHERSFNPIHRVDRELLNNLESTRQSLLLTTIGHLDPRVIDVLLCRLVFACYLFDREIIGESYLEGVGATGAVHLRDVLSLQPKTRAKEYLYKLFKSLGEDFNGDLFSDDLNQESRLVDPGYLQVLDDFFHATDVSTGQSSFWPYDFSAIPIETISAIYERFLKDSEKREGAFYTPRFLAEFVLDIALADSSTLLGSRYLDPSCGSGIFLVGLFNRIAEEWKQQNTHAKNDYRARELRRILCNNLYGIDIDPTACRITAFSLYLAYLDQLSPRDIQDLQQKGHRLPKLIHFPDRPNSGDIEGNLWCGDFFDESADYPTDANLVVGNPPWGSTAVKGTSAAKWCAEHQRPIPDKQVAAAFVWKATYHVSDAGKICLVLPHGTLFNQSKPALTFQRSLFRHHAVTHVLNLADFQRFLFEEAGHPAVVIAFQKNPPSDAKHKINYWAPKTDWLVTRAEVITLNPEDRFAFTVGQVLSDLDSRDAPQIWKQRYWATPRDWRLLERLSLYPRLRDHVRQMKEKESNKRWLIAEGFQPVGKGDDPNKAELVQLPSSLFIDANSPALDLFLLKEDCTLLPAAEVVVRSGSNKSTQIFRAPHVLVAQGFTSTAFADFDVSFRHALRGISGPEPDRNLLIFLAAYLRSSIAKYFLFHTSSNWGVGRQRVGVEELLRLPFPTPQGMPMERIVRRVTDIVSSTATQATKTFANRSDLISNADTSIEPLLDEYFDILPTEKLLINDTLRIIIPSARPTRRRSLVPTIHPSTQDQRNAYTQRLCDTLNGWARSGNFAVQGRTVALERLGLGVAILNKGKVDEDTSEVPKDFDVLAALARLRSVTSRKLNTLELVRGVKVFDQNRLYVLKPINLRFWTQTAALNDADEIAGALLMSSSEAMA